MDQQQEYVLRTVEESDIRIVRLWFTDVLGTLKSVAIAPGELEGAFDEGIGFDGSAIEGLSRVFEADMIAKPDASTFQIIALGDNDDTVARMFCHILTPAGDPARPDPRNVLKRAMDYAGELGFNAYVHPEIEFYLFKDTGDPDKGLIPVDRGGYFDHVPRGSSQTFRRDVVFGLENVGIPVEFSHHEAGPGQNEIDLRYADMMSMADNIMTFRALVKEIALQSGMVASFMPKPMPTEPGNGMHSHISLFEGDSNAFYDPSREYKLSATGRSFIAGLLTHAREIAAVTNQYVNSYKRLWTPGEAPSYIAWGHNNRSALIRVPGYKPDKATSTRVEFRGMDSAANPYLAFAVLLRAGLKGIEEGYTLPEAADADVNAMGRAERKALGIVELPQSLAEAVELMESSDLVAETLGEEAFAFFLSNKIEEWESYRAQVTPFEIDRLLHSS